MVEHVLTFICDVCGGRAEVVRNEVPFGGCLALVLLPSGWSYVRGKYVCPHHQITLATRDGGAVFPGLS